MPYSKLRTLWKGVKIAIEAGVAAFTSWLVGLPADQWAYSVPVGIAILEMFRNLLKNIDAE